MPSRTAETLILAGVILATLAWMDLLSSATLGLVARLLLGWAVGSTLLVGALGAWVALRRRAAAGR